MKKVKNVKMKPWLVTVFKVIGFVVFVCLCIFAFYRMQINSIKKLSYSEEASNKILFSGKKDYVLSVGKNKTLNKAFESEYYDEKYLDNYVKIKYVDHKHFIENINKLIDLKYSNNDINIIFSHGTDESVSEFTKREKVHYLEEYFSYDFAKIENYDRYVAYSDEFGTDPDDTIVFVNLDYDKAPYEDAKVVDNFSIDMLVNKHRRLEESFVPSDLTTVDPKYTNGDEEIQCSRLTLNAFIDMYNDALSQGYDIYINSAYRSFQDQSDVVDLYTRDYGESYVEKYVAKVGYSEHQTGLALDVASKNSRIFANSKEYQWMIDNAYKYGFILRYDKRFENYTLFKSEAWHFRYVGKKIAKYIYENNNMPFEEYYVMFLDK